MSRLIRYWPVVVLFAAAAGLGWNVYYRAVQSEAGRSDFLMLVAAGEAVLDGADIYHVEHRRGWPFYYPPTMAVAMAPFAWMPLGAAVLFWYGISVAALGWAGYRLVRLCDELAGKPVGQWVVAAFVVNLGPIAAGLQRGQVSALLFMFMVEAFWCYRAGRAGRAGLWIAAATGLKLYPALLVLPMLMRRDWRGVFSFVLILAGLWVALPMVTMGVAVGYETFTHWLATIVWPFLADPSYAERDVFSRFNQFSPSNQSLFGVLARWLARGSLPEDQPFRWSLMDLPVSAVRWIGLTVSVLLVVVMAELALSTRPRRGLPEAAVWCLPMVAVNFISHVGWHHYYVSLTMLYALAATAAVTRSSNRLRIPLSGMLGLAVVCNWLHFGIMFCRQMGLLMWGHMLLCAILAAVAASWSEKPTPETMTTAGTGDRLP